MAKIELEDTIKKDVQIEDQTVEVEGFKFNVGDNPFGIKWTLWDKITIPFYRLKRKVKYHYWQVRYSFQRMFRGYDDTETFEMFSNFIDRYKKILTDYRKHHYGHPAEFTNEQWEEIVDRMIHCLDMMNEEYVEELLKKDMPEGYIPSCLTVNDINERYKNEFFQLFSKYFYNLWD